ncbi:MAG: hypothetical protein EOP00_28295 [Pedobacter sp.]|nr:MAG: hypothetical protein EOP00_28295 [Pedobacter sp.]
MNEPSTYASWVELLNKFSDGDDAVLEYLSKGNFVVDAGTVSRFYLIVENTYKKRKQNWLDKFQRSFQIQSFKTDNDFEIALRNGKQNLQPLTKFVALNAFPEELKKALKKDFEDFIAEITKSLKDNISKISKRREKMLIQLNNFGVCDIQEEIEKTKGNQPIPATGRQIIF